MMADKGLNLFDECAAESVLLCILLSEDSKMYTSGTTANLQRKPTKINKMVLLPKQES